MSDMIASLKQEPFSDKLQRKIDELVLRYPRPLSALVPILRAIQEEKGCVSPPSQLRVAERMAISPAWVAGVVSFYTMLNEKKIGKYHLQICRTLPCALRGCGALREHISRKLQIPVGGTSADGKFTLSSVECLGSCDTAPVVQINDQYFEDLTLAKIDHVLARLV
ncbi:MAG: NAD(P)H-dependent oxidoreductase subunit E [Acidobacteriota bacterium]